MSRVDIIYAETLEQLETAVATFLETSEGRTFEPSGGPFEDRDARRWGWAMRKQRGVKDMPPGEVSLRERRH